MERSASLSSTTTTMRVTVGCAVALFAFVRPLVVHAANGDFHQFNFHVANMQRNGMQRTVVNGPSQFSSSLHLY